MKKLRQENNSLKEETLTTLSEIDFNTILQLNRVQKILSQHITNYIVIIKEVNNIIINDVLMAQPVKVIQPVASNTNSSNNYLIEQRAETFEDLASPPPLRATV